jgi:hypothetical protein
VARGEHERQTGWLVAAQVHGRRRWQALQVASGSW